MPKDVEEFDEVPHHGTVGGTFGIIHDNICTTETSWFVNVFKGRMRRLYMSGTGIGGGARASSLSSLISLPLVDVVTGGIN